ncbi:MAG: hypothetical protein A2293_10745 [Elusimicrobia bacterium RIFOXYB2_FULL_49_7]|nr:MAG: hypothetical protein A2293_10745 [Elusimicrobia bacterium RIFOXYB2_FULL_49_7]
MASILRSAPIGITLVIDRIIWQVNAYTLQISGYTEMELLGKNSRLLYTSEEEYEEAEKKISTQIQETGQACFEVQWQHKDGKVVDVQLNAAPVDPADSAKGLTCTFLDISNRKQAEEMLMNQLIRVNHQQAFISELTLMPEIMTGNLPDLMMVLTEKAAVLMGSERVSIWFFDTLETRLECLDLYCHSTGRHEKGKILTRTDYESEFTALRNNPFVDVSFPLEDPRVQSLVEGYLRPYGITALLDARIQAAEKNHGVLCFEHVGKEHIWEPDEITFACLLADQIALTLLNQERRIAEAEKIRLEESLRQAEKMRAIGQLAGGIAHDFNNQLTGIIGYSDLIRDKLAHQPELRHYADMILSSAQYSAQLTSQLLAFARKGKFQSVRVDMHTIIREILSILTHTIDRSITLTADLAAAASVTLGDPAQLQNAVLNLALNARDAMSSGGEMVFKTETMLFGKNGRTGPSHDVDPGEYLHLSVSDTGVGMDATVKERLFEPFFTTKEKGRGVGLGLAAVYGIVKNHKGCIEVQSEPGQGSVFHLYFPLTNTLSVNEPPTEKVSSPAPSGRCILLVDDENLLLQLGCEILQGLGHQVIPARNGQEAIACFKKAKGAVDVIFLDMIMPGLNGRDTFAVLHPFAPHVPIVLMSGYSLDGETQKLLTQGAFGFIQKPFRKTDLVRILETLPV